MRKILSLIILFLMTALPVQAQQKSMALTSYHPSPKGAYDRLTLVPRGNIGTGLGDTCAGQAGTLYVNNATPNMHRILFCGDDGTGTLRWSPLSSTWTQQGDNLFPSDINNPDLFVGIGTDEPDAKLHVVNGALLASGTTGNTPVSGAGTRFMWIPAKSALRAGTVTSTQWDDANIGFSSLAVGRGATASELISTALGFNTTASGPISTALGSGTVSSGGASVAIGLNTFSSGGASIAMGSGTASTSIYYPISMGLNTTSSGKASTAMGNNTTASGDSSTAMGNNTTAQAYGSLVTGQWNLISGTPDSWAPTDPLFVIGNGTDASNRANAVTVLKNGWVGIGTANPTSRFQVHEWINFDNKDLGADSYIHVVTNGYDFSTSTEAKNTFIGYTAGEATTTGSWNTFVGYRAGYSNTTGSWNTFIGTHAGRLNTTGTENVFIGSSTGYNNTTGINNTFIGSPAGQYNTTGSKNLFFGFKAGLMNTTGQENTFLGYEAGRYNQTGSKNVYIGKCAGLNNNGTYNVFIGDSVGENETNVSYKLYIDNSSTSSPLIYGDFQAKTVHINGTLSKTAGTFEIDHPLDPENKVLRHSFTESPEPVNIYQGQARLADGKAEIHLPDYFDALNHPEGREIHLACIGGWSPLFLNGEIQDNRFVVQTTDEGNPDQEFSWTVYGVRNDAFIRENPIIVEEEKGINNDFKKGEYLHPEVFAARK